MSGGRSDGGVAGRADRADAEVAPVGGDLVDVEEVEGGAQDPRHGRRYRHTAAGDGQHDGVGAVTEEPPQFLARRGAISETDRAWLRRHRGVHDARTRPARAAT